MWSIIFSVQSSNLSPLCPASHHSTAPASRLHLPGSGERVEVMQLTGPVELTLALEQLLRSGVLQAIATYKMSLSIQIYRLSMTEAFLGARYCNSLSMRI